jgi:hypothetical protein
MNATQEGDPREAAGVIETALNAGDTPLRLQPGEDAVNLVRAHWETMPADLSKWEALASDTKLAQ